MVERVARFLCEREGREPDELCHGEGKAAGETWVGWQAFASDADELLRAMRSPTTWMIAECGDLPVSIQEAWPRLIDAARSDPGEAI
ncbi:hypothetical protein [Sphingomonas sp. RT2P30]|uniref:hypothetical protein n=1 Tax=Parasphingomonas halimpatiens TaxID=3096162 RepID=UPI002FCB5CFF